MVSVISQFIGMSFVIFWLKNKLAELADEHASF
jgi:hypothetical protein